MMMILKKIGGNLAVFCLLFVGLLFCLFVPCCCC